MVTQYLTDGCRGVQGLILMSPVDGVDPAGIIDNFVVTPGELLNFETPTVILPTGLDNQIGNYIDKCFVERLFMINLIINSKSE